MKERLVSGDTQQAKGDPHKTTHLDQRKKDLCCVRVAFKSCEDLAQLVPNGVELETFIDLC